MAVGMLFVVIVLEASVTGELRSGVWGEGIGEKDFSEKLVVEDAGDTAPPQPKNVWSLEPPGDLGCF
jgi:hypothetical protein